MIRVVTFDSFLEYHGTHSSRMLLIKTGRKEGSKKERGEGEVVSETTEPGSFFTSLQGVNAPNFRTTPPPSSPDNSL